MRTGRRDRAAGTPAGRHRSVRRRPVTAVRPGRPRAMPPCRRPPGSGGVPAVRRRRHGPDARAARGPLHDRPRGRAAGDGTGDKAGRAGRRERVGLRWRPSAAVDLLARRPGPRPRRRGRVHARGRPRRASGGTLSRSRTRRSTVDGAHGRVVVQRLRGLVGAVHAGGRPCRGLRRRTGSRSPPSGRGPLQGAAPGRPVRRDSNCLGCRRHGQRRPKARVTAALYA